MTQGHFLKPSKASFSLLNICFIKAKEASRPNYLPIVVSDAAIKVKLLRMTVHSYKMFGFQFLSLKS